MVRVICEPDVFASRKRGTLPNKALQRTALRAAAERQVVGRTEMKADKVLEEFEQHLRRAGYDGAPLTRSLGPPRKIGRGCGAAIA